ncbi:MAG: galactose mutarotase [Bacteroides sp.]|nr:galactose mutarotase [Bacteroides sp.]MCM1095978.1 galactose mutarotase [Terasakiella sp.]
MTVKQYDTAAGRITHIRLVNASGASATLSTLGAGIVGIEVPDAAGRMADVVLGYADPAAWMADGPCAGKVPGRYANRIARGRFAIDGHEYTLAINNGPNALHGGPTGFQNRIWTLVEADDRRAVMEYVSADGEEGYPGTLTARATYTWSDDCELRLELSATVEGKPTVVNLTNHAYFNLAGHDAGSVLDHTLRLAASRWLPTDDTLIPTGEIAPVAGTPMDFTEPKALGRDIRADFPALTYGKGYDNCYVLDPAPAPGAERLAAVLADPASGRVLTVATTQPGVQVYTGNWLAGCPASKSGTEYADYDGVAIECQGFPDAPNRADFPSQVLRPGEEYRHTISFKFTTIA